MIALMTVGPEGASILADLARACGLDDWIDARAVTRFLLADPTSPPELRLLAVCDGIPCGFAGASLREGQAVVQLFGVIPEHRREGIGTRLLTELEARARDRGITRIQVTGVPGGYFYPGVPLDATPAICLLERCGYRTDRTCRVDMDVDLTTADLNTSARVEALAGQGVQVRRATRSEVPAVARFAEQHFSRAWGIEVQGAVAADADEPPLFAAWHQGEVVSFAVYDTLGHARFGPTGTRPDMRQRGIGTVLLKLCLASMRSRGDLHAQIIWVGPIGFYARAVNARIHRAYWSYGKDLA
ncbi:MAG: GNAT family N-acetyltransferase [Anaerolineae bacterium]